MRILNRAVLIFTSVLPIVILCICGGYAVYIALAVVLHECAHLFALRLCGGRVRSFRPAPFGLCIDYSSSELSLLGELFVSAAGCLLNLLVTLAAVICYAAFEADFMLFGVVNAVAALVNLIPVYPLDGARVLFITLSFAFEPFLAARISFAVSCIFGFISFIAASYLLVTSAQGIYPLLFSIYIFAGNVKFLQKGTFF